MMESKIIGLTVGLISAGVGLVIATMRNGASQIHRKPKKVMSFATELNAQATLRTIIQFTQKTKYKVDAVDEENGCLVLSDGPTFMTWVFFYPIILSTLEDGSTLVEIGIKSKLVQVGPLVTLKHEKCLIGIKAAISDELLAD